MSTTDPTGEGGGGQASRTPTDDNVTPVTPSTGIAISPGAHHQQHPPPSPLSGCYLLVVLPEPHTAQHRDLILNRLAKGFLSWDKDSCHVDLEKELQALVAQAPEGEEARNGERLIQYATENLVTEVLIHPQTNTLLQCMRNLLASFTKHRHIIHAGYTFSGNGSWILQDGTFSLADFLDAFSEHEVQRVLRAYENSVTVDINCAGVGEWSTNRLSKEACTRSCRVRLNPDDVLTAGVPAITSFTNYVGQYLVSQTLDQLMEPSDVVGNIRFSHPTLYVFPGGQGDAALFGINGFNMLVDGGFARKACFWDFARHLDRLDAVLITRVNNSNVGGMSSVLRKKRQMHVYPQIGHFFCNLIERRHLNSPDGDKDLDPLILNLTDIGHEMMVDLRQINLRAHPCYRDPNPINLYHKVGHGSLDMYVLSPSKNSREVREFLTKWHASDSKLFSGSYRKDSNNLTFPIQNLVSICALLVWQPANPEDTITRILFPGSTPQHKIFEGIDRLKHLEFLKHPVCTAKSLSPSSSLLALKDRPGTKQKLGLIEETKKAPEAKKEKREAMDSKVSRTAEELVSKATPHATPVNQAAKLQPAKIDVKTKKVIDNKKIETESKRIEKDLREMKKESLKKDASRTERESEAKRLEGYRIKTDNEKTAMRKESRARLEPKKKETKEAKPMKISKPEQPAKPYVKMPEKKQKAAIDKKDSVKGSPPTPKKSMNGAATKVELTKAGPRPVTKPSAKPSLSTMPGKSAKDANNRKVVEQKNIENASAAIPALPTAAKLPAKQKTAERKPIGRRPKPVSPIKARMPISPTKSTRSTPTTSVKSEKDGIVKRVKGDRGTTDSSTVSTPSGIEVDSMTKLADKCLTEKSEDMSLDSIESKVLADLKEEREVVEEIEAVLQKAERIEGARREDHLDGDDEITAEATDKKEEDMTEDDVTADIEELPKKESSRKTSHELTEEDEYLIIEKEEIYIEDSVQSGEGEGKHAVTESDTAKIRQEADTAKEKEREREEEEEEEEQDEEEEEEEAEVSEEKEKADVPEKQLALTAEKLKETESEENLPSPNEVPEERMKNLMASAAEAVQKAEEKDDSGKKDSEDITKEQSSLSPDKFDSSEKKTTDTDAKPEIDQKDQQVPEKLEESHERISTLESGATTTAPELPEDERIPLDEIKEVIDEKCIAEQEKKAESAMEAQEAPVAQMAAEPKPEAKPFEVHPPLHGIQREIVKTPDEVADLPVHEEVDPTLYRMEQFEKAKEDKPSQAPAQQQQQQQPQQETKEPVTPPVKEQKGVFSFFGKVADKFEKGMDKLTGKSRRDSEKDIDEKSSSKSGSPKEPKSQSVMLPGEVEVDEPSPVFAKVGQAPGIVEAFETGIPEISKIKVAAIKDTATFLKDEIEDLKKTNELVEESRPMDVKPDSSSEKPAIASDAEAESLEPVFATCVLPEDKSRGIEVIGDLETEEDAEDVEALLEEASKKFKTVKDSLHDSLESLEEKIAEQEMVRAELEAMSKDIVKDTLCEVVGKLEDIKPSEEDATGDARETEKVKFHIPGAEDFDDSDLAATTKDFKEAVRDVGEVLAGSAGILIEEKPKDVIEIVKKVAEVLKEDDFLSHDRLFDKSSKLEDKTDDHEDKPKKLTMEATIMPKKVGVVEELPPQEETEEIADHQEELMASALSPEAIGDRQIRQDPCTETKKPHDSSIASPVKVAAMDEAAVKEICDQLMDDENILASEKQRDSKDPGKSDVMDAGIEPICVRHKVEKPQGIVDQQVQEIEEPDITFDRKVSPVTAEVVMVTPDLSPMSPKLPTDKMESTKIGSEDAESHESLSLPADVSNALGSEEPLGEIIEDLVFAKKLKITLEIIEYITIVRKITRERVIYTIEQVSRRKGVTPESLIPDFKSLESSAISSETRDEIEQYINDEYQMKNQKITMKNIEDISEAKSITKRVLVIIITEYITRIQIPRERILAISEKDMSRIEACDASMPADDTASVGSGIVDDEHEKAAPTADKHFEINQFIVDELITKGQRITPQLIDDVCVAKSIPRRLFVGAMEKIITERGIPRASIFDISDKELSELLASEKEEEAILESVGEEDEAGDTCSPTPEKRSEIVRYISEEFVEKKCKITPDSFDDISERFNVSRRIISEIIDDVIAKNKMRRESILNIAPGELAELLAVDTDVESTRADTDKVHRVIPNTMEIEKAIVEEYVSKNRKITPYIFEDICIRYKVSRRIVIQIIEEIIVKRNVLRNTVLDITDSELSELLAVFDTQSEEDDDVHNEPTAHENLGYDDTVEDKLIDGFVSVPSADGSKAQIPAPQVVGSVPVECEKDVDDFEAVEQEYKIDGSPVTLGKDATLNIEGAMSDDKTSEHMDDTIEDSASDVVEAEEKISTAKVGEEKSDDRSGISETGDTTEKYLMEVQEKSEARKSLSDQPSIREISKGGAADEGRAVKSDSEETEHESMELGADEAKSLKDGPAVIAAASTASAAEHKEERIESEDQESKLEGPAKDVDSTSPKDKEAVKDPSPDEETALSSSTVRRMVVTASSEDGGQETEVCPTGSITFTPDDSLKSSPIKSGPQDDSLQMDKESLHSGISTPEKDSISDKSLACAKPGDKVTPEDSLDKSPSGTRDSQDLEDSLDKSDLVKVKDSESPEPLIEEKEDTAPCLTSAAIQAAEGRVTKSDASPELSTVVDEKKPVSTTPDQLSSLREAAEKSSHVPGATDTSMEHDAACDEDADRLTVHTKSPSPHSEHSPKAGHDASKRSSIVSDTRAGSDHDSRPVSPGAEHHRDEDVTEQVKSPSPASPSSQRSKSPTTYPAKGAEEAEVESSQMRSTSIAVDKIGEKALDAKELLPGAIPDSSENKEATDKSRLASISSDEPEKDITVLADTSRFPSAGDEKGGEREESDRSSPAGMIQEKPVDETVIEFSRSASITTMPQEMKDEMHPAAIPSAPSEDKEMHEPPADSATEKHDELVDRSRSPSLEPEQVGMKKESGKEFGDDSKSTKIGAGIQDEKEPIDTSKGSGLTTDKHDEQGPIHHSGLPSGSPSPPTEKDEKKEPMDPPRSPGIHDEDRQGHVIDSSELIRSAAEKPEEQHQVSRSRSSSIAAEKQDAKQPVDPPRSPGFAKEIQDEKTAIDSSRPPSDTAETIDDQESVRDSRSPSIVGEKHDGEEAIDKSRSPSIIGEKHDEKEPIDRSRASSIALEKSDKEASINGSRSPSIFGEEHERKELIDRSKSPAEKFEDQESTRASRSPSIVGEKPDGKETIEKSRSPSIAPEKSDKEGSIDGSRSPSILSDKHDGKDPMDKSRSPSIIDEKLDDPGSIRGSRSASIFSEKHDGKIPDYKTDAEGKSDEGESIDHSRSPSIVGGKHDKEEAIDGSRSASIVSEKHDDKKETDRSRSSSITGEKLEDRESIDRSRSPSIVGEKHEKNDTVQKSRSPSVVGDKHEGGSISRSRSPSVVGEEHDEKESISKSRSPSIAAEKDEGKEPTDRSRSSSIIGEEQVKKEMSEKSRSPSVTAETPDGKEVADEEESEKQPIAKSVPASYPEKPDVKEPTARSPSINGEKLDTEESIGGSRSPSIIEEKLNGHAPHDRSRSPSIVDEKQEDKESVRCSRSPSVVGDKLEEYAAIRKSRSASIVGEKFEEPEAPGRSRSPSVIDDHHDEKEQINQSKSPSVAAERPDGVEPIDRSRSHSIVGEKHDEKESVDGSRSPSIYGEKHDGKESIDGSRSPSIVGEKHEGKEAIDASRSPSVACEKPDEKEAIDRSRSPSIADGTFSKPDSIGKSRSPSVVSEKHDEKEQIDRSKSPSLTSEKPDETELIDRSRSPSSTVGKKPDGESVDGSRPTSIVGEEHDDKGSIDGSRSPSIVSERLDNKKSDNISQPSSIIGDKHVETESIDGSRSPSIVGDNYEEKHPTDKSRSPSIAAEKFDRPEAIHHSTSPSITTEKPDEEKPSDRSRSSSVVSTKPDDKDSTEASRPPSICGEKDDEGTLLDRSRSPSVATEKQNEKEPASISAPIDAATGELEKYEAPGGVSESTTHTAEECAEEERIDPNKSSRVVDGKREKRSATDQTDTAPEKGDQRGSIDHSRSASISAGKHEGAEPADRSKSSSPVAEQPHGREPADAYRSHSITDEEQRESHQFESSRSPSIAAEISDAKELISRSRGPSIAAADHHEDGPVSGIAAEELDAGKLTVRSRSASTEGDMHHEKDLVTISTTDDLAAGKPDLLESPTHQEPSRIVTDKQEDSKSAGSPGSPIITSEKSDTIVPIDRSRKSSVASQKQDELEPDILSRSPAVEKPNELELNERSSFSIPSEKPLAKETAMDSELSSVAAGKPDDEGSIHGSSTPGSTTAGQIDTSTAIHHTRSPSISTEDHDEKESTGHSPPRSAAADDHDQQEAVEHSRSPSIAPEKQEQESITIASRPSVTSVEKQGEEKLAGRSRSSSLASDKPDAKEPTDRSETSAITDRTQDADKPTGAPESSGTALPGPVNVPDQIQSDILSDQKFDGQINETKPSSDMRRESHGKLDTKERQPPSKIDHEPARKYSTTIDESPKTAPALAVKKDDALLEPTQLVPETSSVATPAEKFDDERLVDDPKPLSGGGRQSTVQDSTRIGSESPETDRPPSYFESTSIKDGKDIEKDSGDLPGKPKSPGASDGDHDSAIQSDKKSRSPSIVVDKGDRKESLDVSSTGKISDDTDGVHGVDDKSHDLRKYSASKMASAQDSKLDETDAVQALQKLAETIADTSAATEYESKLHIDESAQHETSPSRSRSQSLFDAEGKTPLGRSRTASLFEDKVPEGLSSLGQVGGSRKSSLIESTDDKKDGLTSDSRKFSATEVDGKLSKRSSVGVAENIAGQFAVDEDTDAHELAKIKEYIVSRYIIRKEKIDDRIVDEITALYPISRNTMLELIEAIIVEENVPRDSIVSFPKDDETCIADIVSKDDHVDVIDISPEKRDEIQALIREEFVRKNKKISSKDIDELAALTYISRHVIVMIIRRMIDEKVGLSEELIEDGIFKETRTKLVPSAAKEVQSSEPETMTVAPVKERTEAHGPASMSTQFASPSNSIGEKQLPITEQKRVQVETYIMEECVKKGIRITVLVLEQIIRRMGVSKSVLLDIIENIIVSRKMSRTGMIDDAIYDETETVSSGSPEHGFGEGGRNDTPELLSSKERFVEFSGKSTPDPKSSGYSTPEVRQYEDKFRKEMSSYSSDYESPFHKAFVGGMTEIRTTHITTLSGKSTPECSFRGETPESQPDSVTSNIQGKAEEKIATETVTSSSTSGLETTEKIEEATSIPSTETTTLATETGVSTTADSAIGHVEASAPSDKMSAAMFLDDNGKVREGDIDSSQKSQPEVGHEAGQMISHEIHEEEEPIIERKIIKREVIEESPQTITTVIRRSIIEQEDELDDDCKQGKISRGSLEMSPEMVQTITVRTTKTIVMEDPSRGDDTGSQVTRETIISKSASTEPEDSYLADKQTAADEKTFSDLDHKFDSDKTVREAIDILQKVETPQATSSAPVTSTPGAQTSSLSHASIVDGTLHDDKPKPLGKSQLEKMGLEKTDHPIPPIIKDLISDERSYSGRTSPDISLPKDVRQATSPGKPMADLSSSQFTRDSTSGHTLSGKSTPDKRPASRSSTATPEGLRSNEVIRTTITTTRTMSEEGDIITTTMEITETTNEKGETTILAEKTDVKVEDRALPADMGKSTFGGLHGFESTKPGMDPAGEADGDPVSPRSDHSSLHSRAGTHVWGSEDRQGYSDEEVLGSPLSTTSQVGYSPQSTYHFGEHSFGKDSSHKSLEFSEVDMSSSFYGELADLPPRVTTLKSARSESSTTEAGGGPAGADSELSLKKISLEKDVHLEEKPDPNKYMDEADLDFEKALAERKEIKRDRELLGDVDPRTPKGASSSQSTDNEKGEKAQPKKDPLAGWDSPLGLPSPKPPRRFNSRRVRRTNESADLSPDSINFDVINDWGEPLRLPSPAPVPDDASNKGAPSTPKKDRKQPKKVIAENMKNRKRSESPAKNEKKPQDAKSKVQPVYMDLAYVPHHGNSYYTSIEFFKRVRARYYVFSGTEPSREVYDALLDAKKTWEDKDLEVTMIPTYDTDTLGYWVADNEEALAANHIDLSPSASRCTINLQDHETSCSAYRLEF